VLILFYRGENPFVHTILLPHFHRFGWWSETLVAAIGLWSGFRHVARLTFRHKLLRLVLIALIVANLSAQWELHRLWLAS